MDYWKEAKNGEQICIDELRVSDMIDMVKDLKANQDDYVMVLTRIYYAGYSVGYTDAMGLCNAQKKADQDGSIDIDIE